MLPIARAIHWRDRLESHTRDYFTIAAKSEKKTRRRNKVKLKTRHMWACSLCRFFSLSGDFPVRKSHQTTSLSYKASRWIALDFSEMWTPIRMSMHLSIFQENFVFQHRQSSFQRTGGSFLACCYYSLSFPCLFFATLSTERTMQHRRNGNLGSFTSSHHFGQTMFLCSVEETSEERIVVQHNRNIMRSISNSFTPDQKKSWGRWKRDDNDDDDDELRKLVSFLVSGKESTISRRHKLIRSWLPQPTNFFCFFPSLSHSVFASHRPRIYPRFLPLRYIVFTRHRLARFYHMLYMRCAFFRRRKPNIKRKTKESAKKQRENSFSLRLYTQLLRCRVAIVAFFSACLLFMKSIKSTAATTEPVDHISARFPISFVRILKMIFDNFFVTPHLEVFFFFYVFSCVYGRSGIIIFVGDTHMRWAEWRHATSRCFFWSWRAALLFD